MQKSKYTRLSDSGNTKPGVVTNSRNIFLHSVVFEHVAGFQTKLNGLEVIDTRSRG